MNSFQNAVKNAVRDRTSDIYITGGHPMVTRTHGEILFHHGQVWSHREVDELVKMLLTPKQMEMLRERNSVDQAITYSDVRLRINFFVTTRGLSLAVRILPGRIPTIDMLNLHPSLNDITGLTSGLVLTCGSTGVGKTSTIAALIDGINRTRAVHIITLENPVEYRFQSNKAFIQQRELGSHMPSFAQGLVDVLRENPDVIVVGELREPETMQLTLNAAQSGHLVISTLHASTPEEAIYRLCNAVPSDSQNELRYQIASTLKWLIIQQLTYLDRVKLRVPLLTIVRGNASVKSLIRENKLNQISTAIQTGKGDGMFTAERYMNEYLLLKSNFEQPGEIFQPSPETSQEILYRSPLLDPSQDNTLPRKRVTGEEGQPVTGSAECAAGDVDKPLTSDHEDVSIQDLIKQLNGKG